MALKTYYNLFIILLLYHKLKKEKRTLRLPPDKSGRMEINMKITQVRNATLIIEYGRAKFLLDPMLAEKGSYPPFANTIRQDQKNPLVSLPMPISEIINVDAVIVTHLHLDHFDDTAKEVLTKSIPLFCQNKSDARQIAAAGFTNIKILDANSTFAGITLKKTPGKHGSGLLLSKMMGNVCGIVFSSPKEKKLYAAGDTVWCEEVKRVLQAEKPEVIIVNGGDNQRLNCGSLVMGKEDILNVCKYAPNALIISSHMEAVNHWTLSRKELRAFTEEKGISSQVLIPQDGEVYSF